MAKYYAYKEGLKAVFLKVFPEVGRVAAACRKAGISPSTFYRWNREDLNFHEQYMVSEDRLMRQFMDKNFGKVI